MLRLVFKQTSIFFFSFSLFWNKIIAYVENFEAGLVLFWISGIGMDIFPPVIRSDSFLSKDRTFGFLSKFAYLAENGYQMICK